MNCWKNTDPVVVINIPGVVFERSHKLEKHSLLENTEVLRKDFPREMIMLYEVRLVVFCGKGREDSLREALINNDVNICVPENKWLFFRSRKDKAEYIATKIPHCAVLIDSNIEILERVYKLNPNIRLIYFDPLTSKLTGRVNPKIQVVSGWKAIQWSTLLLPTKTSQ